MTLFVVAGLALVLLALFAGLVGTFLLLVDLQPRPRLFLVPFESGEDRVLELVVGLQAGTLVVSGLHRRARRNTETKSTLTRETGQERNCVWEGTDLLLELLVDGV